MRRARRNELSSVGGVRVAQATSFPPPLCQIILNIALYYIAKHLINSQYTHAVCFVRRGDGTNRRHGELIIIRAVRVR